MIATCNIQPHKNSHEKPAAYISLISIYGQYPMIIYLLIIAIRAFDYQTQVIAKKCRGKKLIRIWIVEFFCFLENSNYTFYLNIVH